MKGAMDVGSVWNVGVVLERSSDDCRNNSADDHHFLCHLPHQKKLIP
jgi:hypothetical protein